MRGVSSFALPPDGAPFRSCRKTPAAPPLCPRPQVRRHLHRGLAHGPRVAPQRTDAHLAGGRCACAGRSLFFDAHVMYRLSEVHSSVRRMSPAAKSSARGQLPLATFVLFPAIVPERSSGCQRWSTAPLLWAMWHTEGRQQYVGDRSRGIL